MNLDGFIQWHGLLTNYEVKQILIESKHGHDVITEGKHLVFLGGISR